MSQTTLEEKVGSNGAKLDMLCSMMERHLDDHKTEEERLRKVETKIGSLFIVGPILIGIVGVLSSFVTWDK